MSKKGTAVSIAFFSMMPWLPASAAESVPLTACSSADATLSFIALGSEGAVESGTAVIPIGSSVSFSVAGSYRSPPGATRLAANAVIAGIPTPDQIKVTGALLDLSDLKEPSFTRAFTLTAPPWFPQLSFKARLVILGAGNAEIGCFEFPAKYVRR
jgi:hypothetical protein